MILCVLLKKGLYCGNKFYIYFVDFVAQSLVSCIVIIDGGLWGLVIKSYRHGMTVLSVKVFKIMIYDS